MPAAMARLWSDTGLGDVTTSLTALAVTAVHHYREVLSLSSPHSSSAPTKSAPPAPRSKSGVRPDHLPLRPDQIPDRGTRAGLHPCTRTGSPLLAVALLGGCQQYTFLCLTAPSRLEGPRAGLTAFAERLINLLILRSTAVGVISPVHRHAGRNPGPGPGLRRQPSRARGYHRGVRDRHRRPASHTRPRRHTTPHAATARPVLPPDAAAACIHVCPTLFDEPEF
jgi:hypothetical protein